MNRTVLSACLISLLMIGIDNVSGQEKRIRYIGLESGMDFQEGQLPEYEFIRGDLPPYGSGSVTSSLKGFYDRWYAGVKAETRSVNGKFGISAGIRYSGINSSLGRSSFLNSASDFFYLRYKQEGATTEYLKIREINQYSQYTGIPIELRYFPFGSKFLQPFCKFAATVDYRLNTTTDVLFENGDMEVYEDDVIAKFSEPSDLFSTMYLSAGLKLGKANKLNISVEAVAPSFVLTNNSSGLVNPSGGGGFQVNIQVPF